MRARANSLGRMQYRPSVDAAFAALTAEDDGRACRELSPDACRAQPGSFLRHAAALTLTKSADGLIDPKLVLSWLLTTLGAPAIFVGLLVPVREAGALLPQLFTAGWIRRLPRRKWVWAGASLVQGAAALAILAAGLTLSGAAAGATIVAALAVLAVARSFASVSYKDVLGKTVDKARRGTATGLASSAAAASVVIFALLLMSGLVERGVLVFAGLGLAGIAWILAGLVFATLAEEAGATEGGRNAARVALSHLAYLRDDPQLRRFILVRGCLVATALAPPYLVMLGAGAGGVFEALGALVLASALAGLVSSYVWGRLADRSSRLVLAAAGGLGAAALLLALGVSAAGPGGTSWALPVALFALMIAYQGVRLGRATHLVDMAPGDRRAVYTALANTVIGLLLLAGGLVGALAALAGPAAAVWLFVALSAAGGALALGLDEVQAD